MGVRRAPVFVAALHIARQCAEQGWTVLVGTRDADRGAEAAAEFGGRSLLLDVTDAETIATAAAAVPELDVLVNNAGISLDTGAQVTETDVQVFRRTFETNVFGVVAVTNAFLPALVRSAHPRPPPIPYDPSRSRFPLRTTSTAPNASSVVSKAIAAA